MTNYLKGWAGALVLALMLSGCAKVDNILDVGFAGLAEGKEFAVENSINGTITGAKNYCRLPQDKRLAIRERADAEADSRPDTAGIRIRVTCQDDEVE